MIKTTEYFGMEIDELLATNKESGWTREECKIYDDGLEVVWYDNEQEMEEDKEKLQEYLQQKGYEIKHILLTINERIAIVLV